jgi:hypothetical protein
VKVGPAAKLLVVGNESYGSGKDGEPTTDPTLFKEVATEATLARVSRALDDLRRLGELDLRLNHSP